MKPLTLFAGLVLGALLAAPLVNWQTNVTWEQEAIARGVGTYSEYADKKWTFRVFRWLEKVKPPQFKTEFANGFVTRTGGPHEELLYLSDRPPESEQANYKPLAFADTETQELAAALVGKPVTCRLAEVTRGLQKQWVVESIAIAAF